VSAVPVEVRPSDKLRERWVASVPFIELVDMVPFDRLRERVVASIPFIELVDMRPFDRLRERGCRAGRLESGMSVVRDGLES